MSAPSRPTLARRFIGWIDRRLRGSMRKQAEALQAVNARLMDQQRVMRSLMEDLQTSKERLETRGHELLAANLKLREMAGLKDEFVAKVSHELRTPLTSIKEGLSLLLDGVLGQTSAEQSDFLKTIDADIDRLAGLINDMLDVSKIEAGRMRLRRARLEVRPMIEALLKSFQPILGRIAVRTEILEVPPVFADANRMQQVFTNLLSNAMKFTPQDGIITFRAQSEDGLVSIAVEDTGPGIAPDDLPKLFEKFSQVSTQAQGGQRGTGLGLVVTKELVELHGGTVEVASTIGRGTVFTVTLPAYTDALALAESFREIREAAIADSEGQAALVVIQADRLLDAAADRVTKREALERVAVEARKHLHRGDIVLPIEPSWAVILAATAGDGAEAIVGRLRERFKDGEALRFGAAFFPQDGEDAAGLMKQAVSRLDSGPVAAPVSDRGVAP